jgi:polysaccharide biosynthesis/export protein
MRPKTRTGVIDASRNSRGARCNRAPHAAATLWCAILTACSSAPTPDALLTQVPVVTANLPPGATAGSDGNAGSAVAPYILASGDELDVKIPDAPQYDQTVKVRPDGRVNLNVVGAVDAGGHSPEELQEELRHRYKELAAANLRRDYLIHANDELDFKFPYHPQLNDQMRVRPDGKVQLQLAGTVEAEGLSPEELERELRQRYAHFLKDPELAVIVRTATSQEVRTLDGSARGGLAGLQPVVMVRNFQTPQVFITGEVARPGMAPYASGLTLLQALAEAGGTLPSGDVSKLVIVRRTAEQTATLVRPGLTQTYRGAPTLDVVLRPYDVILLPPTRAQNLADELDRYVYKLIAPLKNSSFNYVFDGTRVY